MISHIFAGKIDVNYGDFTNRNAWFQHFSMGIGGHVSPAGDPIDEK
jgi:hypothetical protein